MSEKLENKKDIKLRKISSLDGSDHFSSIDVKKEDLQSKETLIPIPKYEKTPAFRNTTLKRLWARARYLYSIAKQKASGRDYPLIVVLVVNNSCNWNCTYCFGDYPNRKETDYTTDEIKYLIDKLYDMGTRYLNMHGGETLLRNDIGELVNYTKQKGMYCCIITNGSLLPQKIEEVRQADNIVISLDGRKENGNLPPMPV